MINDYRMRRGGATDGSGYIAPCSRHVPTEDVIERVAPGHDLRIGETGEVGYAAAVSGLGGCESLSDFGPFARSVESAEDLASI